MDDMDEIEIVIMEWLEAEEEAARIMEESARIRAANIRTILRVIKNEEVE